MRKYTCEYKELRAGKFPQDHKGARKARLHLTVELAGRTRKVKLGGGVKGL